MSNSKLQSALSQLRSAGALGLPDASAVAAAKSDAKWSGKKGNGDPWELVKNAEDSFNCMC